MRTIGGWLVVLLGLAATARPGAAEGRDWYFQVGGGGVAGFNQSGGRFPAGEFGVWKKLARGDWHTTGVYLGHGGTKTTVRDNALIPAGDTPVLLTHLLIHHTIELSQSWSASLEYGFSSIGFDFDDTSLSLIGLGYGAGVGYALGNDWLLTFKLRNVLVNQSYFGDLIRHGQFAGAVGLAIPLGWPRFLKG